MSGKKGVLLWGVLSVIATIALGVPMLMPEQMQASPIDRTIFLPGDTTDGHYQIEIECETCHTERFGDVESIQSACVECHSAELELVDDSHPRTKFTDPRNADRVELLDARWCVTCHQEHRPEITSTMGLSLPTDYCYRCHENVGEERPTHQDLPFDSCSNSGCHNFHDNRALYEDFLVEHRSEPDFRAESYVPLRELKAISIDRKIVSGTALGRKDHDAPGDTPNLEKWIGEWVSSGHADSGVNCRDCHAQESSDWVDRPEIAVCESCHALEHEGFIASRHGMRLAQGLPKMTPGESRLPMQEAALDRKLDCNQCHGSHAYDTRFAAAEACQECHVDDHSMAYADSPHAALWERELAGEGPPGSGVSCATCHLPRIADPLEPARTRVAHNQNDFLRPRDKMIRSSCLECHGLAFSLDSLADPALVNTNFSGRSTVKVESIHYATKLRWQLEGRDPPWSEAEKEKK
ncbi:MAG: cytochrome c3 family protein [Myxococcota bacterium]